MNETNTTIRRIIKQRWTSTTNQIMSHPVEKITKQKAYMCGNNLFILKEEK